VMTSSTAPADDVSKGTWPELHQSI